MSTLPPKRSHNGCWTCKKRRRKCDEARPACQKCQTDDLNCDGYEKRLRWGVGVASRGNLTGAVEPLQGKVPARQRGRQRDLKKLVRREQPELMNNSASPQDVFPLPGTPDFAMSNEHFEMNLTDRDVRREKLFDEFLVRGHLFLHSTQAHDNPVVPMIPQLCKQSDTLYNIVLALQSYLTDGKDGDFFEHYDLALTGFRADLDDLVRQSGDAILISALLLCTIGMLQGTPWTVHLSGIEKLLEGRSRLSPRTLPSTYSLQAIEVMGVMDLPTFVIGRQTPSLGIWRRFRSGKLIRFTKGPDAVEPMCGLPRSLIDLLSYDGDVSIEEGLYLWPGLVGSILQCHLWEAYRLAAILDIRRRRADGSSFTATTAQPLEYDRTSGQTPLTLPSNAVLVSRAMSAMNALREGAEHLSKTDMLVANAVLYPLFTLGLEVARSEACEEWQDLIDKWFQWQIDLNPSVSTDLAWQLIKDVSQARKHGVLSSPDDIARDRGVEVGLL